MLPSAQDRSEAPLGQSTSQSGTPSQVTVQGPLQTTSHDEAFAQSTVLPEPASTEQVEARAQE
jgi:hypothetical protein